MSSHDPRHNKGRHPHQRDPRRRQRTQPAQGAQPHHHGGGLEEATELTDGVGHGAAMAGLSEPSWSEDERTEINSDLPKNIGQMMFNKPAQSARRTSSSQPASRSSAPQQPQRAKPQTNFSIASDDRTEVGIDPSGQIQALREKYKKKQSASAPTTRQSGRHPHQQRPAHASGQHPSVSRARGHANAPINHTSAQPAVSRQAPPRSQAPQQRAQSPRPNNHGPSQPRFTGQQPAINRTSAQPAIRPDVAPNPQRPVHTSGSYGAIQQNAPSAKSPLHISGQYPRAAAHAGSEAPTRERDLPGGLPIDLDDEPPTADAIHVPHNLTGHLPAVERDIKPIQEAAPSAFAPIDVDPFSAPLSDPEESVLAVLNKPLPQENVITLNRRWPKEGDIPTPMRISYGVWGGSFGGLCGLGLSLLVAIGRGAALSDIFSTMIGLILIAGVVVAAGCAAKPRQVETLLLKTGMLPDDA